MTELAQTPKDQKILDCPHEVDPLTVVFDNYFGRRGTCKLCGEKLIIFKKLNSSKFNKPNSRVRMSKKERRKNRETHV